MMPPVMLRRLLALDLRLLWRGSILLRTRRAVWVPLIATLVAFQAAAYGVAGIIIAHPLPRPQMLLAANVNLLLLSALMLSSWWTCCTRARMRISCSARRCRPPPFWRAV
jgi:ABC-2 type transport system permease protein